MKTLKSLLMLCAGLSFCACNSDNEPQLPEGNTRIKVKIVAPTIGTRSTIADFTDPDAQDGSTVLVTGTYKVTLTAASGGKTVDIDASKPNKEVIFENVTSPTKVTVTLNGGINDYSEKAITLNDSEGGGNLQAVAASIPVYGETSVFTKGETTSTTVDDITTTVTTYEASVQMAIPVARLEIGNISLKTDPAQTKFSSLSVAGVYLDKLNNKGSKYVPTSGNVPGHFESQATDVLDYQFVSGCSGSGAPYILGDPEDVDLKTTSAKLPSANEKVAYAYNFYGATPGGNGTNPQFKIYFDETKLSTDSETSEALPRYAMITNFKKGDANITLENGKIYQITEVELVDQNIVGDEENKAVQYNVEVTVKEAVWSIEKIDAEWAQ